MGVVTNNVNVFISALEGITDTTIMANPKVLALNKQKAEVIVGSETGYLTTTTTETSSTQTVEFLKTGTRLVFRPYIGDDGYIRMEVHPEDSSGGLQTAANLPFKTTTEVTSNVMVKDGHTIVIGGLFRDESSSTKSQVPILGNLPLAGALFRQKRDTTKREEVIILLTPHIVKDDAAYSQLSEQELKDAEKLRVGVRKGMMWTGRSRLAESHYEKALAEMAKPKPSRSKAIWELNCAINLNPQYIEAINMRQELTGKEIAGSDFSSIRTFVKKSMLVDKAAPTTQAFNSDATTDETASATDHDPQQQDSQVAAATPTTQPQSNEAVAQADATADSQQPLNSTDQSAVSSPVTELAAAPTTKPASQPSMADDQKKQPVDSDQVIGSQHPTKTSVTELPTEEVPSASGSSGDAGLNK
jgi:type IV pilus assembly protein PilQ